MPPISKSHMHSLLAQPGAHLDYSGEINFLRILNSNDSQYCLECLFQIFKGKDKKIIGRLLPQQTFLKDGLEFHEELWLLI